MVEWVRSHGYEPYLRLHVEKFRNTCATQRRKAYDNLDAAFRNCVLDDWGRVRFQAQMAARRDGHAGPPWWSSDDGIRGMAAKVGLKIRPGESWQELKGRINAVLESRGVPA